LSDRCTSPPRRAHRLRRSSRLRLGEARCTPSPRASAARWLRPARNAVGGRRRARRSEAYAFARSYRRCCPQLPRPAARPVVAVSEHRKVVDAAGEIGREACTCEGVGDGVGREAGPLCFAVGNDRSAGLLEVGDGVRGRRRPEVLRARREDAASVVVGVPAWGREVSRPARSRCADRTPRVGTLRDPRKGIVGSSLRAPPPSSRVWTTVR